MSISCNDGSEIAGRAPIVGWDNFKDGANFFWYYPKVTAAGEEFTFTVKWDGTEATADTFTIKIASDATLEEAPIAQALKTVNDYLSGTYESISKAGVDELQDELTTLGLYSAEYIALAPADGPERHTAVFRDLWNNKPADGYDLETLTTYFDAMVGTRLKTQESMDKVNNATSVEDLDGISWVTLLNDHFASVTYATHSGKAIADKKAELQDLVDRYAALPEDNREAALTEVFEGKPYARSQATLDALDAALKVQEDLIAAEPADALAAINTYLSGTYESISKAGVDELQDELTTLGLYSAEYIALAPADGPERHTAVFRDLWNNKPADGYDLETLTTYFDAMVGTRLKTQESMDKVNNATSVEDLDGISWVTLLNDHFASVTYATHSGKAIADKKAELQDLVDRYAALPEDNREAALTEVFEGKPYARSQATLDALDAALKVQEGII